MELDIAEVGHSPLRGSRPADTSWFTMRRRRGHPAVHCIKQRMARASEEVLLAAGVGAGAAGAAGAGGGEAGRGRAARGDEGRGGGRGEAGALSIAAVLSAAGETAAI